MRTGSRVLESFALSIAATFVAGCSGGVRDPTHLERWDACMIRRSTLAPSTAPVAPDDTRRLEVRAGANEVLVVHRKWGGGIFALGEYTWARLEIELPADRRTGRVVRLPLEGFAADYREGHSITNYRAGRLAGTVRFVGVGPDVVTLDVDLRATAPIVDFPGYHDVPLRGRIEARRERGESACFR